jgi:CubicO group peptidase (beta-lactamase class C family)
MIKYFLIPFYFFVILLSGCGPKGIVDKQQPESANSDTTKGYLAADDTAIRVDEYLKKITLENNFSGAILIMKNGKKILSKGYGWANAEEKIPFKENTLSCMGSITKAFTAAAIMKLQEQGKLKVTDNIKMFFANVPPDKENITIHQLLTHAAGFVDFFENDGGDYAILPRDSFIKRALTEPLQFKPGTKSTYTNVGMSVLAAIIEKVTNKTYEEFLQEQFFAKINASISYHNNIINTSVLAIGYDNNKRWGTLQEKYKQAGGGPYWNLIGNGGLYASINDMHKWILAIDNNIVLREQSKTEMFKRHIAEDGMEGNVYFGYGCNLQQSSRGTNVIDNGGSNGIYHARLLRYTDDNVVVYLITNNNKANSNKVMPNISQLIFKGKIEQDFLLSQEPFNNKKSEEIYNLIIKAGADVFSKTYKQEFLANSVSVTDDLIYLEVGQRLINENKTPEAIALYKVYTSEFPSIIIAWNDLAECYASIGDNANASICFNKALKISPNNQRALAGLKALN